MALQSKKKSKELDISGTVKKKKKSKELAKVKSGELVAPKIRKISKLNTLGMRSILGDSVEEIQQLLERDANESAMTLTQKRMMQTILDLIPYAEHNVRESKGARGVYQINSLLTSMRELMIDMQSTRDKGQIGDMMVEKIVRPAFLDLGMTLVQEDARMLKNIKDEVPLKVYEKIRAIHEESLSRTAAFMKTQYADVKGQAIAFMQQ